MSARVVFISHTSRLGGGELALAQYLALPSRHERHVIVLEDGPLARRIAATGTKVSTLGDPAPARTLYRRTGALRRALLELDPDLVVANGLRSAIALRLSRFRRAPLAVQLREGLTPETLGRLRYATLTRAVLPAFDRILVNSAWTRATVPPRLSRIPVSLVYTVSGTSRLAPRSAASRGDGPLRLLLLSRLTPWKGVDVAIEAMRSLEAGPRPGIATLTIAGSAQFGEDDYEDRLRRGAEDLDAVTFAGHTDDVAAALAQADVLLSTSIHPEPFGQTVVQALTSGIPVIVGDVGGPAETVAATGGGLTVRPGDPDALARAIESLALDRTRWRALAREGLASAARFGDEATVARLDDALELTLARKRKGSLR